MGIIINCILLMLSAQVFHLGFSFFFLNRNTPDRMRYYILLLSIFSGIWCFSYGSIGITDRMHLAEILRIFGVFSINAFLMSEIFLFTGLSHISKGRSYFMRAIVCGVGIADFVMYANRKVDIFIRIGNWTTWKQNPAFKVARSFHSGFILIYFLILIYVGIEWALKNKLKRQKRFVVLIFVSNFTMIFFSIPDTFLPMFGYHPVATSGIGAAACAIVTWYGATRLNTFNIRLGTISRILYDFINAGVVVFDTEERIVMTNPYTLGCVKTGSLEGSRIDALFKVEDDGKIFEEALKDKYTVMLDGKMNNSVYSVSISAARDNYGDPYCFLCVFMDVTEEARAIQELEVANNAKTDFLTSISHEIRTPINSIIGFNEMIIRDTGEDVIREYACDADRASKQLLSIVNDLLDMGQVAAGKMKIDSEEYDFGMLLKDISDLQSVKAKEKKLDFTVSVNRDTPRNLKGDEVRIQQIITNFVTNAIKYTVRGGVRMDVDFVKKDERSISLIIKVKDTGVGIREENLPHLFDAFSRFDRETHKYIEGTGIGLSVVKSLIDMMDGKISVESTYGEGTTFTVTIPQETAGDETVGSLEDYSMKKVKADKVTFRASKASVLIVDDNKMNRMVFKGQLKPLGLNIDEADSGFKMLKLIKEKKYDLIFLDHMMPEMDGVETLKLMKGDSTHMNTATPVIAMTANAGMDAKKTYVALGFNDYIGKPVKAKKIIGVIEEYLPEDLIERISGETEPEKKEEGNIGKLPVIEGIDWKAARENVSDKKTLMDIIERFCLTAGSELEDLEASYKGCLKGDERAFTDYRIMVHTMKNSLALVGDTGLSAEAAKLEKAAHDKDMESIGRMHEAFFKEYGAVAERIRAGFPGEQVNDRKIMDNAGLSERLDIMEKAMADLDMIKLNDEVMGLSCFDYEEAGVSDMMKELSDAVRDYDTDSFDRLIADIRARIG